VSVENVFWIWNAGDDDPREDQLAFDTLVEAFGDLPTIEMTSEAISNPESVEAQAVKMARKWIGVRFAYGATGSGFDCPGLVQFVWRMLGVQIPSTADEQRRFGTPVSDGDLKPGDALFFTCGDCSGSDQRVGVGLFVGEGKFIEAPGSGEVAKISTLVDRTDYIGARRFEQPQDGDAFSPHHLTRI
jgi:cell wall-associated NlpC family hydrolase